MSSVGRDLDEKLELIDTNIEQLKPRLVRYDGSRNHRIAQEISLLKFIKQVIEENRDFFLDELDQYRMFNSNKY